MRLFDNNQENAAPGAASGDPWPWMTPGRFAALLGALIFLACPTVAAGLEVFYFRDFGVFTYPLAFFHNEAFWRGELPLWNPLNNCGVPFLAQWNTITLYPGSLIYLLLPLPWSMGLYCLLHQFLAGMGMYFLARRWTGNSLAAAAAGILFSFGGLTQYALMWANNIAALGWMPWIVLALQSAWTKDGAKNTALAALAGAMQMLAGAPEIIAQTWIVAAAFWLAETSAGKRWRSRAAWTFPAAALLSTALAAVQILPFAAFAAHSQRDTGYGGTSWAMPPSGVLNFFAPLFHMFRTYQGGFVQIEQSWTGAYYVGAAALALAALALILIRKGPARPLLVAALAILTVWSVAMAMGDKGLYGIALRAFPPLGFLRFPVKFVITAIFALPLLAGAGIAALFSMEPHAAKHKLAWAAALVCVVFAATAFAARATPSQTGHPDRLYAMHSAMSNTAARAVFAALILAALHFLLARRNSRFHLEAGLALLVLFWADLATHAPRLHPSIDPGYLKPDLASGGAQSGSLLKAGNSRAMPNAETVYEMRMSRFGDPMKDMAIKRGVLHADLNLLDHAAKVDGFFSLYIRESDQVTYALSHATNDLENLKDFLGVSCVTGETNLFEWEPRATAMPMITAGQAARFGSEKDIFNRVTEDLFDPRAEVFLPAEAQAAIRATNQCDAKVLSRQVAAQRIAAEVEAPAPTMLVIAQSYYHNWRAYVDGAPVPLWKANYAFQAVEVPPGRHRVEIVYEDRALKTGVVISLAALAVVIRLFQMRKQPKPVAEPGSI